MCWRRLSSTGATQALNLCTRRGNVMKISDPREHIWINTCVQKPREYLCAKYLDVCNNIWIKHLCAKAKRIFVCKIFVSKIRENIWINTCVQKPLPQQQKARLWRGHHWLLTWETCQCFSTCVNVVSNCHHQCCYQQCCHCHHQWKEGGSLRVHEQWTCANIEVEVCAELASQYL